MSEITVLENHGVVHNYDAILSIFADLMGGRYKSCEDINEIMETGIDIFYYDDDNTNSIEDITYVEPKYGLKLIKTTAVDSKQGLPICVSFVRRKGQTTWNGCHVGLQPRIYKKFFNLDSVNTTRSASIVKKEKEEEKRRTSLKAYREIYDSLFDKEIWDHDGELTFLVSYFRTLRKKIENDLRNNVSKSYLLNADSSKIIFNSRLVNEFRLHVQVMGDLRGGNIGDIFMVTSNKDLSENGFDKMILNIPPTEFFKSLDDIFFRGHMNEFDFTNIFSLNHIINERRERFPEHIRNRSTMDIANSLRMAVEHSIAISDVDYRFVVPMYSVEHDNIQFLMPIYFDYSIDSKPSNALVIDKSSGFWSIRTILYLKEAYINARLLGNPNTRWLESFE